MAAPVNSTATGLKTVARYLAGAVSKDELDAAFAADQIATADRDTAVALGHGALRNHKLPTQV